MNEATADQGLGEVNGAGRAGTVPVSILILTLNEEGNLPGLLDSLEGFGDVVLYDSLSTDRTREIAAERGCRVVERAFDNWASHQNWAMERIEYANRWVFYLDGDERMTPELRAEIEGIARGWEDGSRSRENGDPVAYYVGRKNYFRGKWIRRAMPPGTIMRFFQPPFIRFERLVNPQPVLDGKAGYLREMFLHYNFSKGITEWFEKHNRYSSAEAMETIKSLGDRPPRLSNLFSGDRNTRRQELKIVSYRLPMRPVFRFLFLYVLKRGFLDGQAGLIYCLLQAFYEFQIIVKVRELQREAEGLPGS